MKYIVKRDPSKGYLDGWLWVPKFFVDEASVKASLTHSIVTHAGSVKVIHLYREAPNHILVPRAFWEVGALPFEVVDCRPLSFQEVDFGSRVKLDHRAQDDGNGNVAILPTGEYVQHRSFAALEAATGGVLQLACGKGKTPTTLHHIAMSRVPAIVMVDNSQLLEQWAREADRFLDVPGGVGLIADGKKKWQHGLVLATYLSVANWADTMPEEVRRWFGAAYWDEGHHLSAPVFAKTASLFYGRRYALTATPKRADGLHVIAEAHVGKVLYKDLTQPLKARFIFYWTGLSLDLTDPSCSVTDKTGEVHHSKVFRYFGRWRERLWRIIENCVDAVNAGRKVLVLGNSVDEVVNLMAIWTRGPHTPLVTDIPYPAPQDVGETQLPNKLSAEDGKRLERQVAKQRALLAQAQRVGVPPTTEHKYREILADLEAQLAGYAVHRKLESLYEKRQQAFVDELVKEPSSAGFMTYGVPRKTRQEFVSTRPVTFAITKYGKEGLDAPALDTIIISTPFSRKESLQQTMGRITGRPMPGKKSCIVVIYRDNIGILHGMCEKLRRHLRDWPVDEGGPLSSEDVNNPQKLAWQKAKNMKEAFEQ